MVKTGLELLKDKRGDIIKGKRIGLVANQSSITSDYLYSHEILKASKDVRLVVIFSPEHGFYGVEQDMVPVEHRSIRGKEENSSIPIISLYGKHEESLKPPQKDIDDLDILIFDIQDIGSRYYTFIYTMSYCMEACAKSKKMMIILDRPAG